MQNVNRRHDAVRVNKLKGGDTFNIGMWQFDANTRGQGPCAIVNGHNGRPPGGEVNKVQPDRTLFLVRQQPAVEVSNGRPDGITFGFEPQCFTDSIRADVGLVEARHAHTYGSASDGDDAAGWSERTGGKQV